MPETMATKWDVDQVEKRLEQAIESLVRRTEALEDRVRSLECA